MESEMAQHPLRWDDAQVRARQAQAIAMKLGGATLQQIVDSDIGYTSTSGVHDAIKRGLDEQVATNAQETIREEIARIDSLIRTYWPKAKEGDAKSALLIVKLQDRRSRYLGLDFLDGVAERHVQIQEGQLRLAAEIVRRIFADDELMLSEEQKQRVPAIANRHLQAVG